MTAPLWTLSIVTDDQGHRTTTPLTPAQLVTVAQGIAEFLAYGKYTRSTVTDGAGHTLVTTTTTSTIQAAVGRLLDAAARAWTPITTKTVTGNTVVWAIAQNLGTPQWQ